MLLSGFWTPQFEVEFPARARVSGHLRTLIWRCPTQNIIVFIQVLYANRPYLHKEQLPSRNQATTPFTSYSREARLYTSQIHILNLTHYSTHGSTYLNFNTLVYSWITHWIGIIEFSLTAFIEFNGFRNNCFVTKNIWTWNFLCNRKEYYHSSSKSHVTYRTKWSSWWMLCQMTSSTKGPQLKNRTSMTSHQLKRQSLISMPGPSSCQITERQ